MQARLSNSSHSNMPSAGSSEALLSGQKPPFRLLVRAVSSADGKKASNIRFVVSDAFVVRSLQLKSANKIK